MTDYKNRICDGLLARKLAGVGAVLLEGPKWCGKTICLYAQGGRSHRLSDKRTEAITVGTMVSGAAMMAMRLSLKLSGDYDSAVFKLVAVPDGISGEK